jgi:hypothetical protein
MGTRAASGEVRLIIQNNITNTLTDGKTLTQATASLGDTIFSGRLTDGVSEEQFSRGWKDERSLDSGNTEDIDLYDLGSLDVGAGAGLDALGQAMTMLEIVYFGVRQTGGTGRLQINATDPSNKVAWMPTLTVANGGALRPPTTASTRYSGIAMFNPASDAFPITDASSHMVRFGASGGSVTYEIMILARHDTDESSSSSLSTESSLSSLSSSSTSSISSVSSSSSSSSHSISSLSSSTLSTASTLSSSSSSSTHSVSTSSTLSSSSSSSTSSTLSSSSSSSAI